MKAEHLENFDYSQDDVIHFEFGIPGFEEYKDYVIMYDEDYDWIQARPGFVLAGLEDIPYQSDRLQLKHGSRIFLYTDGVTEAQNTAHELFGEDRLLQSLAKNGKLPLVEMLTGVRADIDRVVGEAGAFDDITMLAFEYR